MRILASREDFQPTAAAILQSTILGWQKDLEQKIVVSDAKFYFFTLHFFAFVVGIVSAAVAATRREPRKTRKTRKRKHEKYLCLSVSICG